MSWNNSLPSIDTDGAYEFIPYSNIYPYKSLILMNWSNLYNIPSFCNICYTSSYNDLINKPNISSFATSGKYDDLINKPWIINASNIYNINSNIKIGIGTDNPLYTLDIKGNINIKGSIYQNGIKYELTKWKTINSNTYFINEGYLGIGKSNDINEKMDIKGNIKIAGNIYPSIDNKYDLGTSNNRWRDLYLSGNSIYLNDLIISKNSNNLEIKNSNNILCGLNINSLNLNCNNNIFSICVDENCNLIYKKNQTIYYPLLLNNPYDYSNIIFYNNLKYLSTDIISIGNSNKFITNNKYDNDINFTSNFICSNLNVSNINFIGNISNNNKINCSKNFEIYNNQLATALIINQLNSNYNIIECYNSNQEIAFIINSNNNIGINKINPNYSIDINSSLNTNELFLNNINISNIIDNKIIQNSNYLINYNNHINKPSLLSIAFTGNYNDLSNKPFTYSNNNIYNIINSNIGIGITNPKYTLDINGSLNTNETIYIKNIDINNIQNSNYLINYNNHINKPSLSQFAFTGNYNDLFNLPSSQSSSSSQSSWITNNSNIYNSNNGFVGIGKTNPSYSLDIKGDVNINGNIYINNIQLPFNTYSNTNVITSNTSFNTINNYYGYIIFNSSSPLIFPQNTYCDVLLIGAGGYGGTGNYAGGGGAGELVYYKNYLFPSGNYYINVGSNAINSNYRISKITSNSSKVFAANFGGDGTSFLTITSNTSNIILSNNSYYRINGSNFISFSQSLTSYYITSNIIFNSNSILIGNNIIDKSYVIIDTPLVWYNFDNSASLIYDTQQNYNLTSSGNPAPTIDTIDNCKGIASIVFNGINYYSVANKGQFSPNIFSICCWVKIVYSSGVQCKITYCYDLTAGATKGWLLYTQDFNLYLWIGKGSNTYTYTLFNNFISTVAKWNHILITIHNILGIVSAYVNGILVNTININSFITVSTGSLYIGQGIVSGSKIDDYRFFNRILSPNEASLLYSGYVDIYKPSLFNGGGYGIFTSNYYPLARYKFDNSSNLGFDNQGNYNLKFSNSPIIDTSDYIKGFGSAVFYGSNCFECSNIGQFSPDNFSICCWCKITQNSNISTIASCRSITGGNYGWFINVNNNNLEFYTGNGNIDWNGSNNIITSNFANSNPIWSHLAITMNKLTSNVNIYINGSLYSSQIRAYLNNTTTNFRIGAGLNETSSNLYLSYGSKLNDFIFFNRVLTSNEIIDVYNNNFDSYNLNINSSIIVQYPPKAGIVGTFNTTTLSQPLTISGEIYGNGIYNITQSSIQNVAYYPIYMIDYNLNRTKTGFTTIVGNYTNGIYNKTNFIKNDYLGDWFKIEFPISIILTKFIIISRSTLVNRSPTEWKFYGSSNNINWNEITSASQINRLNVNDYYTGSYVKSFFNTSNYKYYGMCVNKVGIGETTINFNQIQYFGFLNQANSSFSTTANPIGNISYYNNGYDGSLYNGGNGSSIYTSSGYIKNINESNVIINSNGFSEIPLETNLILGECGNGSSSNYLSNIYKSSYGSGGDANNGFGTNGIVILKVPLNTTKFNDYINYYNFDNHYYLNKNKYGYYLFLNSDFISFPNDTYCDLIIGGAGGNGGSSIYGLYSTGGISGDIINLKNYLFKAGVYKINIGKTSINSNLRISSITSNNSNIIIANGGNDGYFKLNNSNYPNNGYNETITGTNLILGINGNDTNTNSNFIPNIYETSFSSGGDANGGFGTQGVVIIKVPLNTSNTFNGFIDYNNIINRPYINDLIYSRNFIDIGYFNQINFPLGFVSWSNEWLLYVGNSPTNINNSFIFYHNNSNLGINSKWWFNGTIASTNNEISDYRVKKEIIDLLNPLDKLELLKPKEYYLCDEKDYLKKYGIIAQDVKDVLPELVYTDEDYVANIYTKAIYINNSFSYQLITEKDISNLINIGDEIKILLDNLNLENQEIIIEDIPYHNRYKKRFAIVKSIINNNTIEITNELELSEKEKTEVFIYGKKVKDFLKLDYSSLYTLNIASIQELYNIYKEQQIRIDNIINKIILLENKNSL